MTTTYIVMREDIQRGGWDAVGSVQATDAERAVKAVFARDGKPSIFGTYVAIPVDEFTQFVEGRSRTVISAHVETLAPVPSTP